mmetsp:Transcript_100449/g.199434  ORF Transcript_100449/g.199434 Transcript_100449/m.199434 type:complete len:1099 (-) Transcript_100449:65-3361(-)
MAAESTPALPNCKFWAPPTATASGDAPASPSEVACSDSAADGPVNPTADGSADVSPAAAVAEAAAAEATAEAEPAALVVGDAPSESSFRRLPSGPSWWDRNFRLQLRDRDALVQVKLRGAELRDPDVASIAVALQTFVQCNVPPEQPLLLELEAAENQLGDAAVASIVSGLRMLAERWPGGARVRILKLWNNKLGDVAAQQLAGLLYTQAGAVEELHLSHNNIGSRGLAALLVAVCCHPTGAYPWTASNGWHVPCWFRIEHNSVNQVKELLDALAELVHLRYCLAPREARSAGCTPSCCVRAEMDPDQETPHVHLPYATATQHRVEPHCKESARQLVHAAKQALESGTMWDSETSTGALTGNPGVQPFISEFIECRTVALRVDPIQGAGLDLEPTELGYYVAGLAEEDGPAQELQAGDVILEIAGAPLWGLEEEALENTFGSFFADGRLVRCASYVALEGGCDVVQGLGPAVGNLANRSQVLAASFQSDLEILCNKCGVQARLWENSSSIVLRGRPLAQRWALNDLEQLALFYFPELHVLEQAALMPSCNWTANNVSTPAPRSSISVTEPAVAVTTNAENRESESASLATWGVTLQRQVQELDEDDQVPFEPLEAPDDGPEVFEGEAMARSYQVWRPLRVLLAVGLPGSGKSTLAAQLAKEGWDIINQDTLGNREACVAAARASLSDGKRIFIDRCNVSCNQRQLWLCLADEFECCAGCFWLDIHPDECGQRVLQRFNHPTLAAQPESLGVIWSFADRLEPPDEAEGFVLWQARTEPEIALQLKDLAEVLDEFSRDSTTRSDYRGSPLVDTQIEQHLARASGNFRYVESDTCKRGKRAHYLRSVRRQVEYYFSDENLKRDWFFQEKILEEPESGWLALQWILSCPRIRDVYRASADDVVQALGPSMLLSKKSGNEHFVRRGRPLPRLEASRPAAGSEPEWYKLLHGRQESEKVPRGSPRLCPSCNQLLPITSFSRSQLRKKRQGSLCNACVDGNDAVSNGSGSVTTPAAATRSGHDTSSKEPEWWQGDGPQPAVEVDPALGEANTQGPEQQCAEAEVSAKPDVVQCAYCSRHLARETFAKAQLTKHRRNPKCRECVNA